MNLRSFLCGVAALALTATALSAAQRRVEHVFILSIDGGKPSEIARSEMPVLGRIVKEGAHTWTARTVFPSVTLPSHTSMLTGLDITNHMITWNDWIPGAGAVRVPTVFALARKQGLSTALFAGKEKFRHLVQGDIPDVFVFDAEMPAPKDGKKAVKVGTVPAAKVAEQVAKHIREKKPNLCAIHFPDTDSAGHKYGWGSPEQIKAFSDVDAALAVVRKAIEDAGIADKSVLIISADHGGHDKTHGSNSPEDMNIPWIAWGKGVRAGAEIRSAVTTYDTAATALWLLGIQPPEKFDGKPVTEAFR